LSGAAVLPAADGAEAEGFGDAGAMESGESSSSLFGLVAGLAAGCEPGKDEASVAGAVDAAGMLLGVAGLGAAGAGFVAAGSRTGSLVVVLYCVQP